MAKVVRLRLTDDELKDVAEMFARIVFDAWNSGEPEPFTNALPEFLRMMADRYNADYQTLASNNLDHLIYEALARNGLDLHQPGLPPRYDA